MTLVSFAELVRGHRQRRFLTQEALADRAGLSVRAVRNIERGTVTRPREDSVRLLADALELSSGEREEFGAASRLSFTASRGWSASTRGPCLLPPDIRDFSGREDSVAELEHLLEAVGGPSGVVISAVAGKAGVGKTTLAVHVAHRLRARFPDGQLYVNLRGAQASRVEPAAALARFLRVLGLDGSAIPASLDERAELYRAQLADRRVLVVLDDAADEAQVRPLLPGIPSCAVLVTSRARLTGLEGVRSLDLDVLTADQAIQLLARVAGRQRVQAEPEAAESLIQLCGGLPLAVRIAAAKLAAQPHRSLSHLRELLADEHRRLDELRLGDLEVRASVALSYLALDEDERRTLRRLALLDAPDLAAWVVAPLLELDDGRRAEELVDALVRAQLLEAAGRGPDGVIRYRFHDLLRVYGRERARAEETPEERDAVLSRAFGAWLGLAERADQLLPNGSAVVSHGSAARWRLEPAQEEALLVDPVTWLEAERFALVAAVEQAGAAGAAGMDEIAWDLATSLAGFFELRSYFDEWRFANQLALGAARRTGNRRGQANALTNLGESLLEHDRLDEAVQMLEEALRLRRELGGDHEHAYALFKLGSAERYRGRLTRALQCADQAAELFQRVGDDRRMGYAFYERGTIRLQQRDLAAAEADLTRSLALNGDRDRRAHAQVLRRLGMVCLQRGDLDLASVHLERCLQRCRELDDRLGEAYTLENLGDVRSRKGDWPQALALLDQALHLFRRIGVLRGEGLTLRTLGELHAAQGRHDLAVGLLQQSAEIWRHLDVPPELDRTEQALERSRHPSAGVA